MTIEKLLEMLKSSNASEVSRSTGIPYARISKWVQGKGKPKSEDAAILQQYFGTGTSSVVSESTIGYSSNKTLIPFYDIDAQAGNTMEMDMIPITHPKGMIDVGDLLRDSECAIRIYGNSMVPNYPSGCVVGLRLNKDGIVEYGNVYVIETSDNRYLKRLFKDKSERGYMCYSDNTHTFQEGPRKGEPAYEPFLIPFEKIVKIFRVTGVIKRNENSPIFGKTG